MENVTRIHIPNRLRTHRKLQGYTQKDVARLLGLRNTNRICRWEKGIAFPSAINLLKLSILYRTLVNDLYFELLQELRKSLLEREQTNITH